MLTQAESEVLRFVCDTFVPSVEGSPFHRRSASDLDVDVLFADAIQNFMQPSGARELRMLLSVINSFSYNLLLTGRPTRFSEMGPSRRERYLSAWRDSPIPLKRTAFQALKRLTCFLSYSATDTTGQNPNWSDIGYPGPSRDTPVPLPDLARVDPLKLDAATKLKCDVAVIGSGAGGGVIADALVSAGLDVIVLEQGPYETSQTFEQGELVMTQRLFQQGGTAATKDLSFVLLAGRGAGGGTTVNWNTCLKPPQRVLAEWETDFGIDGVSGGAFSSYLDEVWRRIGVNAEESQRNGNNMVLWDGCRALGYREGSDYNVIMRNAVGCRQRCDFCTYGCIYACKQSTSLTYLPSAWRKGARLLFDTRAIRVVIDGGIAKGVEAFQQSGGNAYSVDISSRAVVVACGGIETPALLLRSGVGDRNVGKYLRLDPTVAVGGIFDRAIEMWKGPPQTVAVWKFIDLDGTYHGFWVEAAPAHPGLYALSIPWLGGREHKDFMMNYYSRSSASIVLLRERGHGRVTVDKDGYPVVNYELGRTDKETLVRGMEETAKIIAAAGAVGIWTTHNEPVTAGDNKRPLTENDIDSFVDSVRRRGVQSNKVMLFSAHIMGSCRMSKDPNLGPTSPTGELHSVKNLFMGDACVFPTSPAVNPMISIMAMARRTAESVIIALRGPT